MPNCPIDIYDHRSYMVLCLKGVKIVEPLLDIPSISAVDIALWRSSHTCHGQ